jgi:hypothetical protein
MRKIVVIRRDPCCGYHWADERPEDVWTDDPIDDRRGSEG